MPNVEIATISGEKVWEQGDRAIYRVLLTTREGKKISAKTFSKQIAEKGFTGEVETYEKPGKYGAETFVRQAKKDGGYRGEGGNKPKPQDDNYTMYLSYAKDLVVAQIMTGGIRESIPLDELTSLTVALGNKLYASRPSNDSNKTSETVTVLGAENVGSYKSIKSEGDVTSDEEQDVEISKEELSNLFPE